MKKTMAVDAVTIMRALWELEKQFLGKGRLWSTTDDPAQILFFTLYQKHVDELESLKNLVARASIDWTELNDFLRINGFDPMFDRPLDGIGAVSIIDMLIEWLHQAQLCTINGRDGVDHVGFEISTSGRRVFKTPQGVLLVELLTKSGDSLWLAHDAQLSTPSDLFELMSYPFLIDPLLIDVSSKFAGVQVPEFGFDIKPDIGFMKMASTTDLDGQFWYIFEAKQEFRLRVNREGARVKVASGIGMRKGIDLSEPMPIVFNQPFIGWFTQKGAPGLPIAAFNAHYDCWHGVDSLEM